MRLPTSPPARCILSATANALIATVFVAGCSETPSGTGNKPGDGGAAGAKASPSNDSGATSVKPDESAADGANTPAATPVMVQLAGPEELKMHLANLSKEGKVVLVDYWGTWCGPCKKNFPHTIALLNERADDGLAVVTVAVEFDPEEGKPEAEMFLTEQKASKSINLLSRFSLDDAAEKFEIGDGFPQYYIYGRDGKLAKSFVSGNPDAPFDHHDVEEAVKAALQEKPAAQ